MNAIVYELALSFTSFGKISESIFYGTARENCGPVEFRFVKKRASWNEANCSLYLSYVLFMLLLSNHGLYVMGLKILSLH